MTIVERIRQDYIIEIEKHFRRHGICHHLEFTRNSEEEVYVRKSDTYMYDDVVMVIDRYEYHMRDLHDNSMPGYAWLKLFRGIQPNPQLEKVLSNWNVLGYIFGGNLYVDPVEIIDIIINGLREVSIYFNFLRHFSHRPLYVDPDKTIASIISELRYLAKHSTLMKGKVLFGQRGPVIQMDVYPDSGLLSWGQRLFTVNFIPAYKVYGTLYVSKPLRGDVPNSMTWRRSFTVYDKQHLSGGARHVLLALEAFRNREPGLEPLTSFHFKTALLYEMDVACDWSDRALVLRFLGVLGQMERSLANGNLPHYFSPSTNLLTPMTPSSMEDVRNVIQRIISSEKEFMEILRS